VTPVAPPAGAGASAGRNRGVRAPSCRWTALLEEQDLWAPEHVSTLIAACERDETDFAYSASWVVDEQRRILWFRSVPAPHALSKALLVEDAIGTPSSVVARRELWDRAGGFDEWLSALGPWDLWIRWSRAARASMASTPTVASTELPGAWRPDRREPRELRRRYVGDARQAGLRFGAVARRQNRFPPQQAPLAVQPPWLAALQELPRETR
jgi:hypothetical protein